MAVINLSEESHQHQIEVAVDDIITLQLDESPTTGYKWEATQLNTKDLELISEDYKPASGSAIGGGGKKTIRLKVKAKNPGSLKFENRQTWSGDVHKAFEVSYY